jgi:hypothetical protein
MRECAAGQWAKDTCAVAAEMPTSSERRGAVRPIAIHCSKEGKCHSLGVVVQIKLECKDSVGTGSVQAQRADHRSGQANRRDHVVELREGTEGDCKCRGARAGKQRDRLDLAGGDGSGEVHPRRDGGLDLSRPRHAEEVGPLSKASRQALLSEPVNTQLRGAGRRQVTGSRHRRI